MTPTRRNRKTGPKKSKLNRNITESSEEESSDAGSVTRCICGEAHNSGLMVQCDKCEVWQHCECIGLIQEKLPDHYYCDQCQPENHQLIKTPSGRSKRLYNTTTTPWLINTTSAIIGTNSDMMKSPTKKRKTSSPPTELILLDNVINDNLSPRQLESSPVAATIEEMESLFVIEERLTRSRRTTTTKITGEEEQQQQQQQRKKVKRTTSSSPSPNSKINTNKSISCQPQQLLFMEELTNLPSPYWNYTDGKPSRENSPPAKIKYPNSKMTFYEMNKRAKQILDCISKIEVEKPMDQQDFILNRTRSLSTCSSSSSLSSASTVPLLDDYTTNTCPSSPSTPIPFIPKHDESSIQILDRVNRELSKFQRKFGLLYQPQHYTRNSPAAIANKK